MLKASAIDMFHKNWISTTNHSSRCNLYREYKSVLEPEKCLYAVSELKLRNILVEFRGGLLRLKNIEGRWQKINDICMRNCHSCDRGIEDEFHFLLVCPTFDAFRRNIAQRHV